MDIAVPAEIKLIQGQHVFWVVVLNSLKWGKFPFDGLFGGEKVGYLVVFLFAIFFSGKVYFQGVVFAYTDLEASP